MLWAEKWLHEWERSVQHSFTSASKSLADARRRMEYAITAQGLPPRRVTVEIPAIAFSGPNRVSFQESAAIGYEKVPAGTGSRIASDSAVDFVLTAEDIEHTALDGEPQQAQRRHD
jgi:hypothetical protein